MFCLSGFRDVRMSSGILQTPPHDWFSPIFFLTQVVRGLNFRFWPLLMFSTYHVQWLYPLWSGRAGAVGSSGVSRPLSYHWFDPEVNVMVPEGDTRTPFVIVARYDGI